MRGFTGLLYLAGLAGGLLVMFHPTLLSGFAQLQTDPGDPLLNHYFLEHQWRWLSDPDYRPSFWSPAIFYPTPLTLTYSENLAGLLPFYGLLRLGLPEPLAHQWLLLLVIALDYVSMVIVLRWFGVHPILAVLGAFLFAFGMPRQERLGHLHILPQFYAPFALWHAYQFLRAPTRGRWAVLLALSAAQLLTSIHLGWFLLFGFAVFVPIYCFQSPGTVGRLATFFRTRWTLSALLLAVWLVGLGGFFKTYFDGNQDVRRSYAECVPFLPGLRAWFTAAPDSLWDITVWGDDEGFGEKRLFTGVGFYALLLVAAWGWRRPALSQQPQTPFVKACLLTALALLLLTLHWYEGASAWWFVNQVFLGANSLRAIGRVYFVVILFALTGGLIALQLLTESAVHLAWRRGLLYGLILLVCVGEQVRFRLDSFERDRFYDRAAALVPLVRGADAALVYHDGDRLGFYKHHLAAMWAGLWAGVPVINGYSGRQPHDYPGSSPWLAPEAFVAWLGEHWQGRLVLVEWGPPPGRRVYRVRPGPDPAARLQQEE